MPVDYQIANTEPKDLAQIFDLFEHSIHYQEKHGYPVWKNYDRGTILKDLELKHQYKVIVDHMIGIVFSVGYEDKIIWREHDQGDALYLHRIVVNPECKGNKLFGSILAWAIHQAKEKGLRYVRMDTWASNVTLIKYYQSFGFSFVENYTTPNRPELPEHNRNLALALLAYEW